LDPAKSLDAIPFTRWLLPLDWRRWWWLAIHHRAASKSAKHKHGDEKPPVDRKRSLPRHSFQGLGEVMGDASRGDGDVMLGAFGATWTGGTNLDAPGADRALATPAGQPRQFFGVPVARLEVGIRAAFFDDLSKL
jgi:hypothetical protein